MFRKKLVVEQIDQYHFKLYKSYGKHILKKVGTANVNLQENEIAIYAEPEYRKYAEKISMGIFSMFCSAKEVGLDYERKVIFL